MASPEERVQIVDFAGADHFVQWNDSLYYLDVGTCGYLRAGRCSVQEIKPFVCKIYPLVPRVVGGGLWLYLVGECPASYVISSEFIERALALTRTFFGNLPFEEYEKYWECNKVGDFDDTRVQQRILVDFPPPR